MLSFTSVRGLPGRTYRIERLSAVLMAVLIGGNVVVEHLRRLLSDAGTTGPGVGAVDHGK